MSAAKPRVDIDGTRERLLRLGLPHAAEQLAERVTAAVKDSVSPHRFVDELLDVELAVREERRVRTSLRLSGLPLGQTLGNFDNARVQRMIEIVTPIFTAQNQPPKAGLKPEDIATNEYIDMSIGVRT